MRMAPIIPNTKLPLPVEVYKLLSPYFLKGTGVQNQKDAVSIIFAHLFFILCWNTPD